MKTRIKPDLMMGISMIIFGTIPLFVRNIAVTSAELALYRAVMAVILIGLFLLITGQKIPFRKIKKEVPLLFLSGVAIGINWILLFEAYKYTTVSVATLCYYFAPVIVMVLSPLFFKEKPTARQIFCFIMSTTGLVMLTDIGNSGINIGILFGLGAAVFYAAAVFINKFIRNTDGIHRTFLQFISAVTVLFPYIFVSGDISLGNLDGKGWINLLTVGLVHTGITYCMYFSSLKELPGQKAAILSYLDPLVAVFISVTVLGETITTVQIIGGLLILGFTLIDGFSINKKQT